MTDMENLENLCYQTNDLYKDAVKWKEIAKAAPSQTERDAANEVANVLFSWHSKMHNSLIKKFNTM